jgi:ElaB/YqjD/DUF883 family membrane-anchored ribosome-binding protein
MVETTSSPLSRAYSDYEETNDPDVIRAQIEQTRAQMSRTVDVIQERLSPERLTQQAKDKIKEATIGKVEEMADRAAYKANRWRHSIVDTMKQNPIPTALVGIGLGWLLMERMRSSNGEDYRYHRSVYDYDTQHLYTPEAYGEGYYEEGYYEGSQRSTLRNVQHKMSDAAHTVQDKTSQAVQGIKETASNIADSVSDTAGNVAQTVSNKASNVAQTVSDKASNMAQAVSGTASNVASTVSDTAGNVAHTVSDTARGARDLTYQAQTNLRHQARRAKTDFDYVLHENPMAVGAVAVAAGITVGLLLPNTQTEDEWLGETRDQLVEQAKATAKETAKKAQHVAEEAYESAKETVKEEARKEGLTESRPQSESRFS